MKQEPANLWNRVRSKVPMKVLSVAVSAAILVMLYRSLDLRGIGRVLTSASPVWLVVSVGMIVPIVLLSALRFRLVAPTKTAVPFKDAGAMTVIAISLNFLHDQSFAVLQDACQFLSAGQITVQVWLLSLNPGQPQADMDDSPPIARSRSRPEGLPPGQLHILRPCRRP